MNGSYKIYTKGGDKGKTSLLGGTRVPKYDSRIEAYGTLDELNSFIGLLRDQEIDRRYKDVLLQVQHVIFTAESNLAADKPEHLDRLPRVSDSEVEFLEQEIDRMNKNLPELHSFILPGGHVAVSNCHIARTICRRAERLTVKLADEHPVDMLIIKYLNRLSDYLFVLARQITKDVHAAETLWKTWK
jgi:cob(I)alamin adenosyltransferase